MNQYATGLLLTIAIAVSSFAFISIAVWVDGRTKERQAFYRAELLKKLAESTEEQSRQVLDLLREQERAAAHRRREGLKLAGLIVFMAGLAATVTLALLVKNEAVWAAGLVPMAVGGAFLLHSYLSKPSGPAA